MFKNKVVLITGGSRGIGRATALKFGALGAKVIINYVSNKKAAEDTIAQIVQGGGYCDLHKSRCI